MRTKELKLALTLLACAGLMSVCCGCPRAASADDPADAPKATQLKAERVIIQAVPVVEPDDGEPRVLRVQVAPAPRTTARAVLRVGQATAETAGEDAKELTPAEKAEAARKEAEARMNSLMQEYEERERKMMDELRADPAWKPSHGEMGVIEVGDDVPAGGVESFCLNVDGTLLVCCGDIRVFSTDGTALKQWEVDFKPQAIAVHTDGTIVTAGNGTLAKLNQNGEVTESIDWPPPAPEGEEVDAPEVEQVGQAVQVRRVEVEVRPQSTTIVGALVQALAGGEAEEKAAERPELTDEQKEALEKARQQAAEARARAMAQRAKTITGIAVTDQDIFVACPSTQGYGYAVWRVDHDLKNAKQIVDRLSGCCGQMDVNAQNGELWVPVNGRHKVQRYDRDGNELSNFGKNDRKAADGFGGCCEPKNLCFDAAGNVYTSESGPPNTVKKFTAEGEFLGVAVLEDFDGGCVRVTVEVTADGRDIFVLDTESNAIRRFSDLRVVPSHDPGPFVKLAEEDEPLSISTFCMGKGGNFLIACGSGESSEVRVVSPAGELVATWKPGVVAQAINVAPDGTVFVGGEGKLVRLSAEGEVLHTGDSPQVAGLPPLPEEPEPAEEETDEEKEAKAAKVTELRAKMQEMMPKLQAAAKKRTEAQNDPEALKAATEEYQEVVQAYIALSQELREASLTPQVIAAQRRAAAMAARNIRTMSVTDRDVFVCCRATQGYGFDVWRTDHDFGEAEKIVTGLSGCCGNMDIQAHDGELWVAENARGRVVRYDRDGNLIATFGKMDRKDVVGFGSCCNPMCIRFGPDGVVYTAESNLGRVKRFSPDGEFLGVVGVMKLVPGCKHVPIGINDDGSRVYMLDLTRNHVASLLQKDAVVAEATEEPAVEEVPVEEPAVETPAVETKVIRIEGTRVLSTGRVSGIQIIEPQPEK